MLSLRTISRSVPRTFSRSIASSALRPSTLVKPALRQPLKQAVKPAYAAFSTSSVFKAPASEGKIDSLALDGVRGIPVLPDRKLYVWPEANFRLSFFFRRYRPSRQAPG
jgi:hypothetical protein